MFLAKITNKTFSEKRGEYIVKISYKKGPAHYLCECQDAYDNMATSFTSISGKPLHKDVKIFASTAIALRYIARAFKITSNVAPYRLTIIKRPKQLYTIRVSRGYGWEYFQNVGSTTCYMSTIIEEAKFFFSKSEAEKKVASLNARNFKTYCPFEVITITAEDLK